MTGDAWLTLVTHLVLAAMLIGGLTVLTAEHLELRFNDRAARHTEQARAALNAVKQERER
jgi:hypothetical protein